MGQPKYHRVLLKISGEALAGHDVRGIDHEVIAILAAEVEEIHKAGVEIGIVIGGGNIFRGTEGQGMGMDRITADHIGMLATVINGLALQDGLERRNVTTRLQTAIEMKALAEPFIRRKAIRHLEKKRVVIFAGGTGHPYFSTDTTASLRAMEIEAEVILKATNVDGIYSADPRKDPEADIFDHLSYMDVIKRRLGVMDPTAISLCMESGIPIIVFNLNKRGNIKKAIMGERVGTIVKGD